MSKKLAINLNLKISSTNNCLPTLCQVLKTGIDTASGLSKLSQIGDLPIEGPEAQSMELLCLVSHPTYDSGLDPGKYRNIFKGERGSRECFFWNAGWNESSITSRSWSLLCFIWSSTPALQNGGMLFMGRENEEASPFPEILTEQVGLATFHKADRV